MRKVARAVRKSLAGVMAASLFITGVGSERAAAMMIPAGEAESVSMSRSADLATVQTALENKLVAERLQQMGLSQDEAHKRLARLSDEQLHQVALNIEQQNPAGDAGGVILVAVAVVLFIVLIAALLKNTADDDDDDDKAGSNIQQNTAPAPAAAPPAQNDGTPNTIIVK